MTNFDKQYADFRLSKEILESLKTLGEIVNSAEPALATYMTKTRLKAEDGEVLDAEEVKSV